MKTLQPKWEPLRKKQQRTKQMGGGRQCNSLVVISLIVQQSYGLGVEVVKETLVLDLMLWCRDWSL
jgi:hypothetical protein